MSKKKRNARRHRNKPSTANRYIKLTKYTVKGHAMVSCSVTVNAETPEKALEMANSRFGKLVNYGGCMVGVEGAAYAQSVFAASDVVFDEVEKNGMCDNVGGYGYPQHQYQTIYT